MYNKKNIKYLREMPEGELAMLREEAIIIAHTENPVIVFNLMLNIIDKRRKKTKINHNHKKSKFNNRKK